MTKTHLIIPKPVVAVWFSCGAASAIAAQQTILEYPEATVRILNNPIVEEDPDNLRFLDDVERWLNSTTNWSGKIEFVRSSKYPRQSCVEVWDDVSFMSGPLGAPCTKFLKKFARQEWEAENKVDYHVLGFTSDEKDRHERFILSERDNVLPVLIDKGITKSECFDILKSAGVVLPKVYREGYPNANCIGCVKATSPTYWNHVRRTRPEIFSTRAEQSRRIGAKLVRVKGKRIFLDELDPLSEGLPLKNMDFECGIFCEERVFND
jgi:hypothetical protein